MARNCFRRSGTAHVHQPSPITLEDQFPHRGEVMGESGLTVVGTRNAAADRFAWRSVLRMVAWTRGSIDSPMRPVLVKNAHRKWSDFLPE